MIARARAAMGAHWNPQSILANAASLFGATLVTSFLGFAFWALAARLYDVREIGQASAAIAAMTLVSTVGVLGLGTLIIGEVRRVPDPRALITTSCLVAAGTSLVLGIALVVVPGLQIELGSLQHDPVGATLFALGVGLTALTVVLDQACVGLLRGGLQLWRNTVFSVVKLVALPAGLLLANGEMAVYAVWALGNAVSLLTLYGHARRLGLHPGLKVDLGTLTGMRGMALNHHWLNLSGTAPRLLLPIIVLQSLGPEANAVFYSALLFAGFVYIVPIHLATALFALGRGEEGSLRRELRGSLRVALAVVGSASVGALLLGGVALGVLGPEYRDGHTVLVMLTFATLFGGMRSFYVATERVRDNLARAASVITLCGLLEVSLALVGAAWGDSLEAITLGYLVAQVLTGLAVAPYVLRAAGLSGSVPD